jgi:hypothetical protein
MDFVFSSNTSLSKVNSDSLRLDYKNHTQVRTNKEKFLDRKKNMQKYTMLSLIRHYLFQLI